MTEFIYSDAQRCCVATCLFLYEVPWDGKSYRGSNQTGQGHISAGLNLVLILAG